MEVQNFKDRKFIHEHNEEAQKKEESRLKRAIAGAVLVVLSIVGLAYKTNQSEQPDKITLEQEDIKRNEIPLDEKEGQKIENNELKVGSKQVIAEGVYEINPEELNVRSSAMVQNPSSSGGDSNLVNLNGKITVVNPVFVKEDIDGSWWMASDANGRNYYFTGNNGGIVSLDTNEPIEVLGGNETKKVEIVATTTRGNVGKDQGGENRLVATIVDLKE
jgi:predicted  nucleic acid-binding Zn-ribbon protein